MQSKAQHSIFIFILSIVVLSLLPSCNKPPVLKLSKSMKLELDTLVQNQKDSIYQMMTSECEKNYDKIFEEKADSILKSYLKEIESLTK